jgi:formylmethanofuran dehydrogenase subunit C
VSTTELTTKTVFRLKQRPSVPLEAEVFTPDIIAPLKRDEVGTLPVFLGKRQYRLDDFFEIDGPGSEDLEIHGDVGRVKWLGRGMSRGRITIHGDAGMHLGSYMKGGEIRIHGNAADWVGGEMKNGLIQIDGNAGGQLGSAYRGSMKGMRGGTIVVAGSAGIEIGMRMRRGVIAIGGPVRDFAGLQMKGGTIVLMSGAEIRTGAWMTRGTIISLKPLKLMPTFSFNCAYSPSFVRLYAKHLRRFGLNLPTDGAYLRYTGDTSVPGKGELLVWQPLTAA